jgi:hypothetical protein
MEKVFALFTVVALTSAGCAIFFDRCKGLGITPGAPLGTLKCFDQHLRKFGLQQRPAVNLSMPEYGVETMPSIAFLEQGKPSALAGEESFNVFVDHQGAIRALLGGI